jgi:hypothetical protein
MGTFRGRPDKSRALNNDLGTTAEVFRHAIHARRGIRGCIVVVTRESAKLKIIRGDDFTFLVGKGDQQPDGSFTEIIAQSFIRTTRCPPEESSGGKGVLAGTGALLACHGLFNQERQE